MSCLEPVIADYYTYFSCLLDAGTPENAARALELCNAMSCETADEDPPSDGFMLSIQSEHDGTGDPEHCLTSVRMGQIGPIA